MGNASIFMWNNDSKHKHIAHLLNCRVSLMPANDPDEESVLFNSAHSSHFPNNHLLTSDGTYNLHQNDVEFMLTTPIDANMDQQSVKVPMRDSFKHISIDTTVWYSKGDQ